MAGPTLLVKRLLFSSIFITLCMYSVFFAPNWLFFIMVNIFSLLALYEFYSMAEKKGIFINKVLGLIFAAIFPLSIYFQSESLIILATILCLFIYNFRRSLKTNSLISTAVTVFGIFYIAWLFSFIIKVKDLSDGALWVFYILAVTKLGDTAAYFVGKWHGKRPLLPHISPNKTVEGAVANLIACILVSVGSTFYLPDVNLIHLFILGTILGVLAQLGDLAESLIKRDVEVKDSGSIPGLGGILDVMDSLLFTVPFAYYYFTTFIGLS